MFFKCCSQATTSSKPETYQVPANFDKSILGEVDVSSKDAAELGLPHAFWLRWMQLREQVRAFLLLPITQCCVMLCVKPKCYDYMHQCPIQQISVKINNYK